MLVFKSKKFVLGEKCAPIKPEVEIKGLNILLELILSSNDEDYETAAIIKRRIDRIELEQNNNN